MNILRRAAAAAVMVLSCTQPAWAAFHIMTIEEVFFGTADCPNAQYVMLRQRADMQNFVGNQTIRNQSADGTAAGTVGPPTPTPTPPPSGDGCPGDCDGSGEVFVNEVVTGVNIALEVQNVSECLAMDRNDSGAVESMSWWPQ